MWQWFFAVAANLQSLCDDFPFHLNKVSHHLSFSQIISRLTRPLCVRACQPLYYALAVSCKSRVCISARAVCGPSPKNVLRAPPRYYFNYLAVACKIIIIFHFVAEPRRTINVMKIIITLLRCGWCARIMEK